MFEEGDLVFPVGHVALDRRGLTMGPDFSSRSYPVSYETESPVRTRHSWLWCRLQPLPRVHSCLQSPLWL